MAYLNEFPHTEASKLNLDWILEQYSTFNQRLAEIVQHFDDSVEQMQSDVLQFKADYETAFNNFKNDITSLVNEYSDKVDSINENIGGYVNEYLVENINTILENNPVLETKYEKIGYIDTHEYVEYTLENDVIYEIMTLDYALNMHKALAVNNAFKINLAPFTETDVISSVRASDVFIPGGEGSLGYNVCEYPLTVVPSVVYEQVPLISGTSSGNVLTITNNGSNRIRVYIKPIATL